MRKEVEGDTVFTGFIVKCMLHWVVLGYRHLF